jgi:hypothetical protein
MSTESENFRTDRARFQFSAREYVVGSCMRYIKAEPTEGELAGLDGMLGFELLPGTTLAQAREIAEYLNDRLSAIIYTTCPDDPQI